MYAHANLNVVCRVNYCLFQNVSAREVYKVPAWVHHMLVSMAILFKNTLDTYSEIYLANKLSEVTQDHRITSLVHLIKGGMFVKLYS